MKMQRSGGSARSGAKGRLSQTEECLSAPGEWVGYTFKKWEVGSKSITVAFLNDEVLGKTNDGIE